MSGICAIWGNQGTQHLTRVLGHISQGLVLRAEDHIEHIADESAGVAVAARDTTQQVFEDLRVLIACDAELFNEDELLDNVGRAAPIAEHRKTAVLFARLYARFGCDFVEKLRGAFSLVVWDRHERKLLAAVDGFGVHRLAYYSGRQFGAVASRVDALAKSGAIDVSINARAIANVLNYTTNLAPATVFNEVLRLEPGTLLVAADGRVRLSKFWDMRYGRTTSGTEAQLAQQLEAVVEQSVAVHCKSDGFDRVGAFLSGGTDSSTVVGMMNRVGRGRVKTFSIGFQEQVFNELGYADITAKRFNADHHTYLVGADDCFKAIPSVVRCFDEPFGNTSAIPTYFCASLAAEHGMKALLAGDGGDELFGGNERYLTDKIFHAYQAVPAVLRKGMIEPVLRVAPEVGVFGRAQRYVRRSNIPPLERFFSYHFLRAHSPADVFDNDFLAALGAYDILETPTQHYENAPAGEHLDRLLYLDVKITLADNDLPKVTSTCELAGIRARFPFLDRSVAEFSGMVPARLKVKGTQKRYLFKQAFRNLLPPEVIRKKKHGFGIPVATWLKMDRRLREWSRDVLLSSRATQRGYFRRSFIEDLCRKHDADTSSYYGDTLWNFFILELWHREFVDAPAELAAAE